MLSVLKADPTFTNFRPLTAEDAVDRFVRSDGIHTNAVNGYCAMLLKLIDKARADVERTTHQLKYAEDQLERTRIRAPIDGRIITPNVHLLAGDWMQTGEEFLTLEDTRTVEAQIDMPETSGRDGKCLTISS